MKAKEIRAMNESDLNDRILEMRKELIKMNAQVAVGTTPKSPGKIRSMKKTIARIYTIMHERELGAIKAKAQTTQATSKKEGTRAARASTATSVSKAKDKNPRR